MISPKKKILITPNMLTVFRIFLAVLICYLLFIPSFFMRMCVAFLFICAVISDYFDGAIARRYGLISTFGKIADPIADKLLILGMYISFSLLGIYSFWWLVPIIVREILVTILRLVLLYRGEVIPAEKLGKLKVGFQIASLTAAWLCLLMNEYAYDTVLSPLYDSVRIILYLSLVCSIFFTLYSGIMFLIKNDVALSNIGLMYPIGTFFFLGRVPFAPGTAGSVGGILLYYAIKNSIILYGCVLGIIFILGVWSARKICKQRHNPDPQEVVIDEVAGILVTFFLIPYHWVLVILGFILFRIFDIVKPWPIRHLEKIKHGYGVMLDDIVAGVFSNFLLQIVYYQFFV